MTSFVSTVLKIHREKIRMQLIAALRKNSYIKMYIQLKENNITCLFKWVQTYKKTKRKIKGYKQNSFPNAKIFVL